MARIGYTATDPVGFHNKSATAQRSGAAQVAVTQSGSAVSTANATDLASAEALANALKTAVNANTTDIANVITLLNELRAALVAKGLIKGA